MIYLPERYGLRTANGYEGGFIGEYVMARQRDANITNTALNHILDNLVIIYTDQGNMSGFLRICIFYKWLLIFLVSRESRASNTREMRVVLITTWQVSLAQGHTRYRPTVGNRLYMRIMQEDYLN